MRDVMRYSGIVTKVAAMRAKLLKPQDYERLASMNTENLSHRLMNHCITEVISKKS